MSETMTRTNDRQITTAKDTVAVLERLLPLLPGISPGMGGPVQLAVPGLGDRISEPQWRSMLKSDQDAPRRRVMAEYVRALLRLNETARAQGKELGDVARSHAATCQQALEAAWTSILEANRDKEESVRWCALFFSNLDMSRPRFRRKIAVLDVTAEELAGRPGLDCLREILSSKVDFPDGRDSFGYVVVRGWVGSPDGLDRMGKRVHESRAILVTDAPAYDAMKQLQGASREGGFLEQFAGDQPHHRHMIVLANRGRVRARFCGRHAAERDDVYADASGPWFGHYLDKIMQGRPWAPHVGYSNPIVGFDGVELPLRLAGESSIHLYGKHRINPLMTRAAGSTSVMVWGADTLSKADRGVQMGVGVVEMLLLRYAEFVVNKEGILNDLEEGEQRLSAKLGEFVAMNSGADRMFRAGSRATVKVDFEKRSYEVSFDVLFRVLGERAFVRISGDEQGTKEIEARRN